MRDAAAGYGSLGMIITRISKLGNYIVSRYLI